jgi:4-amino-4-deoxy-L-arabinose transferase-like glycosyltransferase
MKRYSVPILIILITAIGFFVRFYKLGSVPAGLYVDEAGQGYSAYSLLKTGKDEFGKTLPIVFRSLTDFKAPVYTYLIVPLIPVFGLNTFTVRLPSVLFAVLAIPIFYYLIFQVSGNKKLGLIAALLLAVSPWHIIFSRTAYECMVALTLLLSGMLLFYKSLKKPYLLLFSAPLFAISLAAYQAERVIVPIVLAALFIKHKKILLGKTHKVYLFIGIVIGLIVSIPTLFIATTPGFFARATGLNIFSHLHRVPDGYISAYSGVLSGVINGSWFLSAREFLFLYFSYFSPRYMFFVGDFGPRSSYPELSTFHLWQFPFYIYGLYLLFKRKDLGEFKFITILMMLIFSIPAAVTYDPYTTIRALPLVIPQIAIISLGLTEFYSRLKMRWFKNMSAIIFTGLIIYSLLKLYSSVIILNENARAKDWDYGWKEVSEVIINLNTDLPVVVDNARSDAYPQLAFYLKYDPSKFQQQNFEVHLNEYYTNMYHNKEKYIGMVATRPIAWEKDLMIDQYLIGDGLGISLQQIEEHKLTLISEIRYPDKSVAFRIVQTNPGYEQANRKLINPRK